MMKPANPPVRGTLHKASSKGCGMWTPVVQPVGASGQTECQADTVMENPRLACSRKAEVSAATAAGIKPHGLSSAHQSKDQRSDEQDNEHKEQNLCNLDGPCRDAGKTE